MLLDKNGAALFVQALGELVGNRQKDLLVAAQNGGNLVDRARGALVLARAIMVAADAYRASPARRFFRPVLQE